MQQSLQFITWHLFTAEHVSGVLKPIIRSSTTAVAASGFTVGAWWQQCCWSWSGQPAHCTHVPMYRRLGEPKGRYGRVRKISTPPGFDPRTVQPVASSYTDCAIQVHENRGKSAVDITRSKSFTLSPIIDHSYALWTHFISKMSCQSCYSWCTDTVNPA